MEDARNVGGSKNPRGEGRYIYCVVEGEHRDTMGDVGIEREEAFTIPGGGLSAVVHACPAFPYDSENQEIIEKWVTTHDNVVHMASEKYGFVVPMGFDTIIKGKNGKDATKNVRDWLSSRVSLSG